MLLPKPPKRKSVIKNLIELKANSFKYSLRPLKQKNVVKNVMLLQANKI